MSQKFVCLMILLISSVTFVYMQDIPSTTSEPIVYERETGDLYAVTADGLVSIASLPQTAAFDVQYQPQFWSYKLSADHARLIFAVNSTPTSTAWINTYYVADVLTDTCCQELDPQHAVPMSALGASLSPDGAQAAVFYVSPTSSNPASDQKNVSPQIIVFDLKTAAVLARFDYDRLGQYEGGGQFAWTAEGIRFYIERCCSAEDRVEGVTQVWHPESDSLDEARPFLESESPYWHPLATGEAAMPAADYDFPPATPPENGMMRVENIVLYVSPNDPDTRRIIYFKPDMYYIAGVAWVVDGQALLIHHAGYEETLLLRDGTQIPIATSKGDSFVGGTPSGWVMRNRETKVYTYFQIDGTSINSFPVGEFNSEPVSVEQPELGASAGNAAAFPAVTAP